MVDDINMFLMMTNWCEFLWGRSK